MKKVCAWCKKELDTEEGDTARAVITHGICSLCALKFTQNIQRSTQDILDFLDEPVFIVGPDGVIRGTNRSGQKVLGKNLESIEDTLVGDAFECSYSNNGEGCGRTVHCATCSIRNIIMETLSTGKNFEKVPAFQLVKTPDGETVQHYFMSTERVEGSILLRIDEVGQKENSKNDSSSSHPFRQNKNK